MSEITPAVAGRPTIRDVARVAGVSIKAVSRVINNQQYVSAATRERILAIMAELRFEPSHAARALAGGRTHQLVLICDNPNPWYVHEIQLGMRERCALAGVRMIAQPYDRSSPTLLDEVVSLVEQLRPDGIILTPPACDDEAILSELTQRSVHFARIQPGSLLEASPSVRIDNEQACFEMASHLLGLGHRRIGFLVGDRDFAVSHQRLAGYERALASAGIEPVPALVRHGRFDYDSGLAGADELLYLTPPPTAIFASNDDIAAGALAAAHRRGIEVPETLSIVGFDDAPLARAVWPALTTVRQPVRRLAETAADLLLAPSGDDVRVLPCELVLRESAAAP